MWQSLKQEASQYSNYLGKELDGFLIADVQGAGNGSEDDRCTVDDRKYYVGPVEEIDGV